MAYDLSRPLVIGISSRALFNLEQENKIYEEQGIEAYEEYQVAINNHNRQLRRLSKMLPAGCKLTSYT